MLTKQDAISDANKIQKYAFDNGRKQETWYFYHNHIYGVALIAQKIAEKLGLDSERAFVLGLLHDCGKLYEDAQQRFHGVIGYDRYKDRDPQLALISLNHTYMYNFIESYDEIKRDYFDKKEDYLLTCEVLKQDDCDDYSKLIQLCDALANRNGFVTLEDRIYEYEQRNPQGWPKEQKSRLFILKKYFEDKLGHSLYDLFDEISQNDFIDETYQYCPHIP